MRSLQLSAIVRIFGHGGEHTQGPRQQHPVEAHGLYETTNAQQARLSHWNTHKYIGPHFDALNSRGINLTARPRREKHINNKTHHVMQKNCDITDETKFTNMSACRWNLFLLSAQGLLRHVTHAAHVDRVRSVAGHHQIAPVLS